MNSRIALVTGASRGIGSAISKLLAAQHYTMVTPSREEMDLLSNDSIDHYMNNISQVDVLINNAGINPLGEIHHLQETNVEMTFQTNILAPMRLTQWVLPMMKERKFGRIVNISSIWGGKAKAGRGLYSTTKSALNAWTQSLAIEVASENIMVNAVAPGFVETEMTNKNNSEEDLEKITRLLPIKRLAQPEEIAEVVSFLVAENNTYLTGQIIYVDGGFSCI